MEALPHGVILYREALNVEAQASLVSHVLECQAGGLFAKVADADVSRRYWQLLVWNWPNRYAR